ncbi:Transposon TX1 uncharacterized 149 kDa protein [Vitis vinifera]|uniref:Transposon TX1 uncharacterized 149 kDa protein n=1 Tax=Vitis vinifera TaxID=29760 RepID=A0A438F0I1_VITVI|nr:Transposon TX1 uncharacterized 149 kDa protein [Vitis vinifera]
MCNFSKGENGAGIKGFVGCTHRGSSITIFLHFPTITEKGLNSMRYCGMTVVENFEASSHQFSQPSPPFLSPFSSLALPYPSPSVPDLPTSTFQSQFSKKNRLASLNLLSENFKSIKTKPSTPNLDGRTDLPQIFEICWRWFGGLGTVWCFYEDHKLEGLGSRKKQRVVKDFLRLQNLNVMMFQETKREVCDRRDGNGAGHFGYPPLMGWDIIFLNGYGTGLGFFLKPGAGSGDFNVIRSSSEKLGGSSFTSSMKNFDGFIRDCELLDPPLRNAPFTWSNMQESPVCKRLDRFLYSNEWELSFPQSLQEVLPRWTSDHWSIVLDTNLFKWGPTPFRKGKKTILDEIANIDVIEQEGVLSSNLSAQRVERKGELEELILREEIHWRQTAKVKWVKDGDCNSTLFHKVANGRRNKNFIKFLENERGLVLDNSKSITKEILPYFKKLYPSPPGESWRLDMDKASGSDGFTIAVFQDCWDVIKDDLVIAKVLSGRLRGVLHETIHSTQGTFVQGRQILDAVLITNEIVDEKRRSGEEGVVFKIDFEKAYDHVKWDFLDHVLEKKGFSSKWRIWMRGCLSSVSYAILVNGNAKEWVKASKGLRQGDPLSHFLFTIVADVLSRMMLKAEEKSALEGFRVGRNRIRVSHLQFADDTIFFANSCAEELQTLKSLLLVFGQISGLEVNLDKRNPIACRFWDSVIERISSRLDGWQKAYLSFGGRITLVHSCLSHIPSYFLSLLKIPASVAAKIERLQRDFLWSGVGEGKRDHLISWDAEMGKEFVFGKICSEGDQIFKVQYPRLFRVVTDKNIPISSILDSVRPFSWNFNFRRNLSDSEIKDLEHLMRSLDCMHISTSASDARSWSLSSLRLFTIKSFFIALSQMPNLSPLFPTKLFQLAKMDWVPPRSISDMMSINYKGFGNSKRGMVLWQNACIALIWLVWRERNVRMFEDKARNSENLWDSIHFLAPLWALCSAVFKGIPLNVLQLDWLAVYSSNGTV